MNVLLIVTDQQSNRAMSCAGNPYLRTPHIDRLAASGVRFEQAYCAAPVCGPSRACLLTGRMPHEHGVLINGMPVADDMPTMGELFRDAGYRTAWTGRFGLPGELAGQLVGFDCLHDIDTPLGFGTTADDHVADTAIDFIRDDHQQPFLLGVSLCNPHDICYWVMKQSTPRGELHPETVALQRRARELPFRIPESSDLPPLPANFAIDPAEPEFVTRCRGRRRYGQEMTATWDWGEDTWRQYLHAYYRLTELVDQQVGRVLDALHQSGLADETLVVLTSDHGEGMAAHRWVTKLALYEEATRVPLIFSHPGAMPAGKVERQLASGVDLLPTLCDYAGIGCPATAGANLRGIMEGNVRAEREAVFAEIHSDRDDLTFQGRMVRTPGHKYIAYSWGERSEQLFDLDQDPGETTNLAGSTEGATELARHRALIDRRCRDTADRFTRAG